MLKLQIFWKNRNESTLFWAICFIAFLAGLAGTFFGVHLSEATPLNTNWKGCTVISFIICLLGLYNMPRDVRDTGQPMDSQ